jgi:hypothetical protein
MSPDTCDKCSTDEISPNVEAFEITGELLCDDCWQDYCERQWEREPDYDARTFWEQHKAAWAEHQEAHKR